MIYTIIIKDKDDNTTSIISFDSVKSASESLSSQTTDNTVEYGFPVSDHILLNNITFDLDVVVSNISLFDENLEISWNEFTQSFETLGEPTLDSHITMRRELKSLVLGRKVFSLLITEDNSFKQNIQQKEQQLLKSIVDQYDNCVCNSLVMSENEAINGAFYAKLQIKQVKMAFIQTRELAPDEQYRQIEKKKAEPTYQAQNSVDQAGAAIDGDSADVSKAMKEQEDVLKKAKTPQEIAEEKSKIATSNANKAEVAKTSAEVDKVIKENIELQNRLGR